MSSAIKGKRKLAEMSATERKSVLAGKSEAEIEKMLLDEIGAFSDLEWHRAYKGYNAHRDVPLPLTTIPADKIKSAVKQYNDRHIRQIQHKKDYTARKKMRNEQASVSANNSIIDEFDEDLFRDEYVDQHDGGNKREHKQGGTSGTSGTRRTRKTRRTAKRQQKSKRRQ